MTPFQVANSDGLKTQLQEMGEVIISMWHPSISYEEVRVDQYVDAIRTMSSDLGLDSDDLIMTLWSDRRIHVKVRA